MSIVSTSARTVASELAYAEAKQRGELVPLDQETHIADFELWFMVANRFPYDMVFGQHDLLLPRRKIASREEFTAEESQELQHILRQLSSQYDLVFENFPHRRSIPMHYHLHLASYHKSREDMKL